jgi:hypothetical protein
MPPPTYAAPDLAAALLRAELSGQLAADAWPALRQFVLGLADAQVLGDAPQLDALLTNALGPLRQLLVARQALHAAQQALTAGYTALTQVGDDPLRLATAAQQLALLADDLAARAQQLTEWLNL